MPILREGKTNWTNQELVDLLLNGKSKRICQQRPLVPQKSCSFLIDSGKLSDKGDWESDDLGSWRNCGSSGRVVTVTGGKVVRNFKLPRSVANRPKLRSDQYVFRTTYYRHKKYADFKRNSVVTYDSTEQQRNLTITKYFFTGQEHPVSPDKHGNAKNDRKFIPTAASTKKRIVSALSSTVRGPHSVFDKVTEEVGGSGSSYAASDMPRGIDQISYARKNMRQKGAKDQISELLDNVQNSPEHVHGLQLSPSIRFVVSTRQTLANLVTFSTSYAKCTPLCIDTTYGIGEFFVTTSYKNLKVLNKGNHEHPSFPGPALFHVDEDESVFSYFSQTLVSMENSLRSILFIGSDRDRALINGTRKHFLIAKNLFCKKHVEDHIKRKFTTIRHLTGQAKKTIMQDIFGSETRQIKGLIDCEDERSYDELCYTLYQKWEWLERSCGESITPQFANYFKKYIEKDMRDGMILCKRRSAGMGDNFFYNNQTESMNFRFKNKIREHKATSETSGKPVKKCTFSEAIKIYKDMLESYQRNAERALIGVGPYILAPNFAHFSVQSNQWTLMSANTKNHQINLLNKASLDNIHEQQCNSTAAEASVSDANISSFQAQPNISNLPCTANPTENNELFEFSRSGLSENYRVDWDGARALIAHKDLIKSPWADDSYLVKSATNPHIPNSVSFCKSRHSVKCSCPRFQFHSICKHAISVAFTEGFVVNFVKKWAPNLSKQMQPTVPPRTGLKKNERGQRKRNPVQHRNIQGYRDNLSADNPGPADEQLNVVFLNTTRATTCYGCEGKFRSSSDVGLGIVPPVPYDIVLTRRERRVFTQPGTNTIRIAKTPENVYYHTQKRCLMEKISVISPQMFCVNESVRAKLNNAHKNLLRTEFRFDLH